MNVTALIHTFLRDDYLFDCVHSLRENYPQYAIIVSDDGHHSDEKEAKLFSMGVSKYIRLPWKAGLCVGRNALLRACATEYFLLGDDDLFYTAAAHLEKLEALLGIADIAAGGHIEHGLLMHYEFFFEEYIFPDQRKRIKAYPLGGGPQMHNGVPYYRADMTHNVFMGRTEAVRTIGWDERYKIRWEHEDFFLSAWHKLRIVYCPQVGVPHKMQGYKDSDEFLAARWPEGNWDEFRAKWGYGWLD